MQTLSIDLETYSDQPLAKTGVYRYVESPDFEILLFAYSVDGGSVQQIDLACGEKIPPAILAALEDDKVIKWAFNANFERICLSRFLGYPTGDYLKPDSWKCSMVWAAYMGLPLSLEGAGAVLGLENRSCLRAKTSLNISASPVRQPSPMVSVPATFPNTLRTSGWRSNDTTSAMWRRRCPSRQGSPNIPCRTACGRNTISTRRSTTAAWGWIWNWCGRPFRWTGAPARS